MDIFLHVGMQKSGSTAIQHRFTDCRDWLAAQGLCYPQGLHTPHNHSFLVAVEPAGAELPRHYRRLYATPREAADRARTWLETTLKEARDSGARALFLSAETLFWGILPQPGAGLAALLREAGGRIVTLAYLRRPSEFYVAAVQQRLRAAYSMPPPGPVSYRAALEAWAAVSDEIRVRPYDRAAFPAGDIARAAYAETGGDPRALPELDPERLGPANATLSAEGMALMQTYRRLFHPAANHRHNPDSKALARAIAAAEADPDWPGDGPPRPVPPRLHPELADHVDHASSDLLWLRARHGIVFAGIDYDRVGPRPDRRRPKRVADICPLDPRTAERLKLGTLYMLARHPDLAESGGGSQA